MLIGGEKISLITLGSSCILDFQLRLICQQNQNLFEIKSGIFDWNIITPDASIKMISDLNDSAFLEGLTSLDNLRNNYGILENFFYNGLFFWHEDAEKVMRDKDFHTEFSLKQKKRYVNFMESTSKNRVIFLWSNFQPNLFQATKNQITNEKDFFLTSERYYAFNNSVADKYNKSKTNIYFLVHSDSVDVNLTIKSNVISVDLDRSSDYLGSEGLLSTILKEEKIFDLSGISSNTQEIY